MKTIATGSPQAGPLGQYNPSHMFKRNRLLMKLMPKSNPDLKLPKYPKPQSAGDMMKQV